MPKRSKSSHSAVRDQSSTWAVLFVSTAIAAASMIGLPRPCCSEDGSRTLHGAINAFGTACASSGIRPESTQIPTTVEEVKKGSPAFYAGVAKGDHILSASTENNMFNLKIERQGKVYLARMVAVTDDSAGPALRGGLTNNSLAEILKSFRIRLIIDHSGSMYRPVGHSDKLRWTWVKEQVNRFCGTVQSQAGSAFDIYLFNESVDEKLNQSAEAVRGILEEAVTTGNTNLPAALKMATASSEKPLLIILVTDGLAVSSKENAAILANNLSRSANLRHSRVVFLQAGYSAEGANFIASLQDELAAHGINKGVYSVLFEEASASGILGSIAPYLRQQAGPR